MAGDVCLGRGGFRVDGTRLSVQNGAFRHRLRYDFEIGREGVIVFLQAGPWMSRQDHTLVLSVGGGHSTRTAPIYPSISPPSEGLASKSIFLFLSVVVACTVVIGGVVMAKKASIPLSL